MATRARPGPAPTNEILPGPDWTPTSRETAAAADLAETMTSWRDLDPRWAAGLRVGVVYDTWCDRGMGRVPPRWARLAAEMAWVWARAAAGAAPGTSWTAACWTGYRSGVTTELADAVEQMSRTAGLAGPPVTARLLVLVTRTGGRSHERPRVRTWLDDLHGIGCGTLWLRPAGSRLDVEDIPTAAVRVVDEQNPYPVGMLGAAALEALQRAADIAGEPSR